MRASQAFPSRYLSAADLAGRRVVVTVEAVRNEEIAGEDRRVVAFVGREKLLPLNKTNWCALAEIAGVDDDEHWAGVQVTLITRKVDFQGKRVDAVRIEPVPSQEAPEVRRPPMPSADDIGF